MFRFFLLMLLPALAHAQVPDTTLTENAAGEQVNIVSYSNGLSVGYFYTSGRLASIERTGTFNGCGVPVGPDSFFYDRPGTILRMTIRYEHYRSKKPGAGCHDTWTVETFTAFNDQGHKQYVQQSKSLYESEACPCGKWTIYDADGRTVRTEKHPDCKAQKLECLE